MTRGVEDELDSRHAEFAALRREGLSYRDIGLRHGISHERVRQVLAQDGGDWSRPSAQERRSGFVEELATWLHEHGPIDRTEFRTVFGLSQSQLTTLIAEGLPAHLLLLPRRETEARFSDEDVVEALQRAWKTLRETNPEAVGLSHSVYDDLRQKGDPSAAALATRKPWREVCEDAGVPPGTRWRSESSYKSRWTDQQLLDIVAEYVDGCAASKRRPTYLNYESMQADRSDWPSGTTIRIRMRASGIATWADTVAAAVKRPVSVDER